MLLWHCRAHGPHRANWRNGSNGSHRGTGPHWADWRNGSHRRTGSHRANGYIHLCSKLKDPLFTMV